MDTVLPYVHERRQFDQPIGEFQLMQGKLADMYTVMNAARASVGAVSQEMSARLFLGYSLLVLAEYVSNTC